MNFIESIARGGWVEGGLVEGEAAVGGRWYNKHEETVWSSCYAKKYPH